MRLIDADALRNIFAGQPPEYYTTGYIIGLIDRLPTVCEWISVEDRLPTYAELKAEEVLALFEDGTICSVHFDECIEDESIFGEWRQNFDPVTLGATDSDWIPFDGITHWMPLPEAPHEVFMVESRKAEGTVTGYRWYVKFDVDRWERGLREPKPQVPIQLTDRDTGVYNVPEPSNIPEPCRNCPNHPVNGGSGICHCTLGMPKVTC